MLFLFPLTATTMRGTTAFLTRFRSTLGIILEITRRMLAAFASAFIGKVSFWMRVIASHHFLLSLVVALPTCTYCECSNERE
jgi:hypothetical protein